MSVATVAVSPLCHPRWVCATGATAHPGIPFPPDECGIVAQIAEPLAAADISAYYISTFNFDHALVSPCASPGPAARGCPQG